MKGEKYGKRKTNRKKGAVAAVDFIKLKEEERRKRIKEDLTGLDFKASFREKLLKDFPLEKVEEKLELLKEKKRRKRIKEDLTGLDFKASFREKLLKDFPLDKMEEKLELLKEKKHIINPSGWFLAALKNDYQGSKEEEIQ